MKEEHSTPYGHSTVNGTTSVRTLISGDYEYSVLVLNNLGMWLLIGSEVEGVPSVSYKKKLWLAWHLRAHQGTGEWKP